VHTNFRLFDLCYILLPNYYNDKKKQYDETNLEKSPD
jgi:hypothetical protein